MEKDISSHAEPDGSTLPNPQMIEQRQRVQGTLPVCNLLGRVGRSTVTARVRHDQRIFMHELIATGVRPILIATGAAMKKQERLSHTFGRVIHLDIAELKRFALHDAQLWLRPAKQTILEMPVI
jgi:hypothetical protein